jgi:chromosomal replication initiator protein
MRAPLAGSFRSLLAGLISTHDRIADMTGKRRTANIAFPRQVAMYLARRHTKATLHEIGETFGGRNHGTVLHACKTVSVRMEKEDQVRQAIVRLNTQLER